ncbi:MAG: PD40 domain-containing protein [Dehalococcoidia bacterium]|nr:MAG: PD40 domain-containing protein [Dehalococcoidia bacterium]
MDCKEITELLSSYIDEEVSPVEKRQIEKHLADCPLCREELEELSIAENKLRKTLHVVADHASDPKNTWLKVREAIEKEDYDSIKDKMQPVTTSWVTRLRSVFSLQPIWKRTVAITLVVALVVSLVIVIPPTLGNDFEIKAVEIALNSPEVINALSVDLVETTTVIQATENIATVEIVGTSGDFWTVIVNLDSETVMYISIGSPQYYPQEDLEKVISILLANDDIKSILDQGAIIKSIVTYHLERVGSEFTEKKVYVTLSLQGDLYLADIELFSEQLLDFGDYATMKEREMEARIANLVAKLYEKLNDPDLSDEYRADIIGLLRTFGEAPTVAKTWSPDGFGIIYTRELPSSELKELINADFPSDHEIYRYFAIYGMNADGANQVNITTDFGNFYYEYVCSPDGSRIAYVTWSAGDREIYVMNADGSNQTRLTYNTGNDNYPAWSPNGSQIAFRSNRDGDGEIYVMNADGSNVTRLTYTPGINSRPAWSPDGSKILFYSDRDGNHEIYVMNADGTNQIRLTNSPGSDRRHSWSPDGSHILFWSNRDGKSEIYVMNADGSNQTRLTNNLFNNTRPVWSNDGSRIAFQISPVVDIEDEEVVYHSDIHVMNADGSNQINLTNNPFSRDSRPIWSPDDSMIAFISNRDGNNEIYVMNADGSNVTRLTNNSMSDDYPMWLP